MPAIATQVIGHKAFKSREAFDAALTAAFKAADVEIVCNAGFLGAFGGVRARMVRPAAEHPSFAPAPPSRGLHSHAQALAAGVRVAGATVHFVSEDMDAGPVIAQGTVPVLPADDEETLSGRILAMEHRLFPLALRLVAAGRPGSRRPRGLRCRFAFAISLAGLIGRWIAEQAPGAP